MATRRKAAAIVVLLLLEEEEEKRKRVNRQVWVRDWIARRQEKGAFQGIMRELSVEDTDAFKEFVRMDVAHFNRLVTFVEPLITKEDT